MRILRWFWGLKLRWRIPLGLLVLTVVVGGSYVLIQFVHWRRLRGIDLLALVPEKLPAVARFHDAGAHWDRVRETDVARLVEAQFERHGPLVEWIEAATDRTWGDLVDAYTSNPAAGLITEARLRGLLGRDVIVAAEPSSGAVFAPRGLFLTRIGFLEALAFPVARRLAAGRLTVPLELDQTYRGVDVWKAQGLAAGPAAPPGGWTLAFALRGDILIVAGDPELVTDVIDRTYPDWTADGKFAPWSLPEEVPAAAGIDVDRIPSQGPLARAVREALQTFPLREAVLAADPDALARCTVGLDVRPGQIRIDGQFGLRRGAVPAPVAAPPVGGASPMLAAVPDHAAAVLIHQTSFEWFWTNVFERASLDPARPLAGEQAIGGQWKFFQTEAREREVPALRRAGLDTHLMPRLRAGPGLVVTRENGPPPRAGEPPLQTIVVLVEADESGDGAETALHDLLERRTAPLNNKMPGDVQERLIPAGAESVHLLTRQSWPVQLAYGEVRGVLALGIRPDALVGVHETLQGTRPALIRTPRFRAVSQALERAELSEGRMPPDVVTFAYADLPRWSRMVGESAADMAKYAKDRLYDNAAVVRQQIKQRNPPKPGEAPNAYEERINGLFKAEERRVQEEAQRQIEMPLKLLHLFDAAGMEVTAGKEGYTLKAVLLTP